MPQKEYEEELILVITFAFLFEMPQNRRTSITVICCLKTGHALFIQNAPLSSKYLKCPFPFLFEMPPFI